MSMRVLVTRREVLELGGLAALSAVGLDALSSKAAAGLASRLSCTTGARKTPSTGRPQPVPSDLYSHPGSPRRRNLREPGFPGVLLTLRGRVYDDSCRAVPRAMLDFFQCDSHGKYDRKEIRF